MIYFIQDKVTLLIKIGFTANDVSKRLSALQTGCPGELVLIATIDDGTIDDEAELHKQFYALRERGEWFRPGPAIIRFLVNDLEFYIEAQSCPNCGQRDEACDGSCFDDEDEDEFSGTVYDDEVIDCETCGFSHSIIYAECPGLCLRCNRLGCLCDQPRE